MGGLGTVPPEAWDHTHPDHSEWVGGEGWCYDPDCPDHTYGPPEDEGSRPMTEGGSGGD